ncbi:MAG: SH3 domain-containing protein [Planctomycetaceae bacterium]
MRIAALVGVMLLVRAGWSVAEEGAYAAEVTATQLRLRAGAGEAYQEVVRLEKGAKVIVQGIHANDPTWLQIEVPQGYQAWVFGQFVAKGPDGAGTVTGDRVLLRPRPSTRYHQLAGLFHKGDALKIVGEEKNDEGLWYRVVVPRSVLLYGHRDYLKKIGPASLAEPTPQDAPAAVPAAVATATDKQVLELEAQLKAEMAKGWETASLDPIKRALIELDRADLSSEMRERRYRVQMDLLEAEKQFAIARVQAKESAIQENLEKRLAEIERDYKQKLAQIKEEHARPRAPLFTAKGIVRYRPDVLGRYPDFRLEEGGRIRYYLISTDYELYRFQGKRVGVSGLIDPESGTGLYTVVVKRIEILGEE